ncbi:MAG: polysaccharide biosynthesis protein [Alphaproteobacteria bacterium]|nr:polysaccharide biosynthesis protein [Alphaproteobacteria bacterium]
MVDVCAISLSFTIANYIVNFPYGKAFFLCLSILLLSAIAFNYMSHLHRHIWRSTSIHSLKSICLYSVCITVLLLLVMASSVHLSESLFKFTLVFLLLSIFALTLPRILCRIFHEKKDLFHGEKQRVILIGAGKSAELFLREAKRRQGNVYEIKYILDDNPDLWDKKIFGLSIYGAIKNLSHIANRGNVDLVVIAIASLSRERLLEITHMAEENQLQVKMLPSFDKLLTSINVDPENVSAQDLLGRDSIDLNNKELQTFIKDKVIMVTGAGGSIGSEVCIQLIHLKPSKIILIDHSEYNLYKITWELEHTHQFKNFIPFLISVTNKESMEEAFTKYNPDIIFHAAAYKHVPLLENQIKQAVVNNFLGTKIVADLASQYKSEKFILISTDKAVNPTNIMGSTKRAAELYCQSLNGKENTKYLSVRFGNVLESTGSVIPLFKKQLKAGGPLTVTHPDITRFFMSIPEASQLVIQAGAMGQGGEIFVLNMGEPIKIKNLAERLIFLSGKRPYKDIDIVFTGLRPGEKLYEELFYEEENHIPTKRAKILIAQSKAPAHGVLNKYFLDMENYIEKNDVKNIVSTLNQILAEKNLNDRLAVA